eukprot:403349314
MALICRSYGLEVKTINYNCIQGPKKIDTRVKQIKDGKVSFNEKFQMKTALEIDTQTFDLLPKPTTLQLIVAGSSLFLGETILDLAKYTEKPVTQEKLKLTSSDDPNSYIEIQVKSKEVDNITTPSERGSITQKRRGTVTRQDNSDAQSVKSSKSVTIDMSELNDLKEQLDNLLNEVDLLKKQNSDKEHQIDHLKKSQNDQYSHLSDTQRDNIMLLEAQTNQKNEQLQQEQQKTIDVEQQVSELKEMSALQELLEVKLVLDQLQREHDQYESEIDFFYSFDRFA